MFIRSTYSVVLSSASVATDPRNANLIGEVAKHISYTEASGIILRGINYNPPFGRLIAMEDRLDEDEIRFPTRVSRLKGVCKIKCNT